MTVSTSTIEVWEFKVSSYSYDCLFRANRSTTFFLKYKIQADGTLGIANKQSNVNVLNRPLKPSNLAC
jgi:hypothetical protein